jgi:hypothetical protein
MHRVRAPRLQRLACGEILRGGIPRIQRGQLVAQVARKKVAPEIYLFEKERST